MPLAVLASDATPQEKLLVLAIYHHDWDGEKAWPSLARLAAITSFSEQTLRRAMRDLEARGWLKVEPRPGRSNVYSLDIPDLSLSAFNAALTPASLEGVSETTPTTLAPHPYHPGTPLKNENQGTRATKTLPADAGALVLTPTPEAKPKGKAPWAAADGTPWQVLVDAYVEAYGVAKGQPGLKPELSPADFSQLKRLAGSKGFTLAEYQARLANMGRHGFHARMEFRLAYFCTNFREFSSTAEQMKGGRGGRYLPVSEVEDFKG